MATSFAALLYRSTDVSDEALAHGVGVATAGYDVPAPHLIVADLAGVPGFSVAFYRSGAKKLGEIDELEHAIDLFEDDLSPALAVRDAAAAEGRTHAVVYAIVYGEEIFVDDAFRFAEDGWARRFVRDGDDGLEAGRASPDDDETTAIAAAAEPGSPEEARAIAPHRGSTWLAAELGRPVLPALVAALFQAERRVAARLVDPSPAGVDRETRRLVATLRRVPGRGAQDLALVVGVAPPEPLRACARAYDWADPTDPSDLYRELSLGAIEGTLHFLRPAETAARGADPAFAIAAAGGLYPVATVGGGALGGARARGATVAIAPDGATLTLVDERGRSRPAGPTLGELIGYLALGWKDRDDVEEDLIQALMLRARLRSDAG